MDFWRCSWYIVTWKYHLTLASLPVAFHLLTLWSEISDASSFHPRFFRQALFFLKNIFGFAETWQIYYRVPIYSSPGFRCYQHRWYYEHWWQLTNQYWYIFANWSLEFIQIPLVFPYRRFAVGSHPGYDLTLVVISPWLPPGSASFSDFPSSGWPQFWGVMGGIYRLPLYCGLPDVFLMVRLGSWVWGRKPLGVWRNAITFIG